jgi:hypothetical protein
MPAHRRHIVSALILTTFFFQLFLGTTDKVYIIDKVENNPAQIRNHPAWASGQCLRIAAVTSSSKLLFDRLHRILRQHQQCSGNGRGHKRILRGTITLTCHYRSELTQ